MSLKRFKGIHLLDTTLRDGSYAVDFQFTPRDTSLISLGLEKLGLRWIEIGHGLGLNSSRSGKGDAAATDAEYIDAAASVLRKARFGTFFIPGIGNKSHLDAAKEHGMDFVRIGTNANEIGLAKKYIRHAKSLDLIVSSNLMKSYVLSPKALAENAKKAADWGVDIICLVDSAGGMLPEDVEAYFDELGKIRGVILGFHGHDNLGLAVANTLRSIECGAKLVDVSLQGLGRSAGNASSEMVAAVLKRKNILTDDIDLYRMLEFSHKVVSPMKQRCTVDPINVISGYAKFHSSFDKIIYKYAGRYRVDPKRLIVDLCAIDQVNASESVVKDVARRLQRKKLSPGSDKIRVESIKLKVERQELSLGSLCRELNSFSKKHSKLSVLNIVINDRAKNISLSGYVQESPYFVIGTAEVGSSAALETAIRFIDGKVDYILMDCEAKISGKAFDRVKNSVKLSKVLIYKDNDAWVKAIFQQLSYLLPGTSKKITIHGFNNLSVKLAMLLSETGFKVIVVSDAFKLKTSGDIIDAVNSLLVRGSVPIEAASDTAKASLRSDVVIGLSPGKCVVDHKSVLAMKRDGIVLDGSLGSISAKAVKTANSLGIRVMRVDMGSVISAEAASGIRTRDLVESRMGKKKIGSVVCVAGGLFGGTGDVVLDSIKDPSSVIGVADGKGSVLYGNLGRRDSERVRSVEMKITGMKLI